MYVPYKWTKVDTRQHHQEVRGEKIVFILNHKILISTYTESETGELSIQNV